MIHETIVAIGMINMQAAAQMSEAKEQKDTLKE
jgi:hypothetical protein